MELAIATPKGNKGTVEVSELAFGTEFNQDLVHQTVVAFLAGARQGTRAQKNRLSCIWWWPQATCPERHWSGTSWYYPKPNLARGRCNICCYASGSQPKAEP